MTNNELAKIMNYLDAEFYSVSAKMTNDEKIVRLKHWREELGDYLFEDVMDAVREVSKSGFPPKTAQVRSILDEKDCWREPKKASFRMWKDASGDIMLDINDGKGNNTNGPVKSFSPWEIIKWRAIITKKPESIADWDSVIYASEHKQNWENLAMNILQRMVAAC